MPGVVAVRRLDSSPISPPLKIAGLLTRFFFALFLFSYWFVVSWVVAVRRLDSSPISLPLKIAGLLTRYFCALFLFSYWFVVSWVVAVRRLDSSPISLPSKNSGSFDSLFLYPFPIFILVCGAGSRGGSTTRFEPH